LRACYPYIALLACLAGCAAPPPEIPSPAPDSHRELKWFAAPDFATGAAADAGDEAEIQLRAAAPFYRGRRWSFAASALAEALDYDGNRDDIRYLLLSALLLSGREADVPAHIEEFEESPYEARARRVAAVALLRLGRPAAAREVILPAARVDYEAAGWLARLDALDGVLTPLGE
jgi:hypothetical protein